MEEKLKTFGEMLKESLATRGEELPAATPEASSVELTDAERNAILARVAATKKDTPAQPPSVGNSGQDETLVPFGVLLERTVELQGKLRTEEESESEELREAIISKSKVDFTEEMLKKLIR